MTKKLLATVVFLLFFLVGLFTLKDYGTSWDSPVHFRRGQTYLHYYFTGKLNYSDLKTTAKRSFYQVDDVLHTGKTLKELDMGHPPMSDTLAAVFNYIFYQKTNLLGDIEAHNIYIIFVASFCLVLVFLFSEEVFGLKSAIFSVLVMSLYPLFFAESHFNIKDIPETTFITAFIYFFWKWFRDKKISYFLCSFVFAGFALGTKFNILFVAPIIILWFVYLLLSKDLRVLNFIKSKKTYILLIFGILVALSIFYISWPYLWNSPLENLLKTLAYYREVGTNTVYQPKYSFGPVNLYPILWVILTTNPIVLVSLLLSPLFIKKENKETKNTFVLFSLWLLIPILRVTYNKFSIYGGDRQIMEFIPALAIISGYGLSKIWQLIKNKYLQWTFVAFVLGVLIFPIVRLYPNQNIYFNVFAGGIKGAEKLGIPGAGNTFGNAYKKGIEWINSNALADSHLALLQGTISNLPLFEIRKDIDYSNENFSGLLRKGEYLMELTYLRETEDYYYAWEYVNKFLKPVYEYKVDGFTVLKIWKNDLDHTYDPFKVNEVEINTFVANINKNIINLSLEKEAMLTKVIVDFTRELEIKDVVFVETSVDGIIWLREKDFIPKIQVARKLNKTDNMITYNFASRQARYVRFIFPGNIFAKLPRVRLYKLSGSKLQPDF